MSSKGALISLGSWIIDPNLDDPKGMHSKFNMYPRKSHCLIIKSSLVILDVNMCTCNTFSGDGLSDGTSNKNKLKN